MPPMCIMSTHRVQPTNTICAHAMSLWPASTPTAGIYTYCSRLDKHASYLCGSDPMNSCAIRLQHQYFHGPPVTDWQCNGKQTARWKYDVLCDVTAQVYRAAPSMKDCKLVKWRLSVLDTRVYRGADIDSDHRLVACKVKLKWRRRQEVE